MKPDIDTITKNLRRLILHEADQHYSIQKGDEYFPSSEILTDEDLTQHLAGRRTLGIKLIQPKTLLVKAGAVDLDAPSSGSGYEDLKTSLENARRVQVAAAGVGLPAAIEFSGRRGWHVWIFSSTPIPAATMRQLLTGLTESAGCVGAEIFPAGERITDDGREGSGSKPVKLPCGLHQVSGGWSGWVGDEIDWREDGRPALPDQAAFLATVEQVTPEQILEAIVSLCPVPSRSLAFEEHLPYLAKLEGADPACISWLRQHGAPLDQYYNAVNLTLARYAVSRGLGEDAATVLALEVAQATPSHHPTTKQDPAEKVHNFHSALKSARQEPARYAFNCSYVWGSKVLKAEACTGRSCPAWPYPSTESSPAKCEASPADTQAEREAIAFVIAHPGEALPLALQQQIPLEAFRTHLGETEEPRHRHVWEAVIALAGQEVRPSLILAEWETRQAAPTTVEQVLWLGTLIRTPACSRPTFERHLDRLRDTGLRELLARHLRAAEEGLKQRDALPCTLDTLITAARQLQSRGASSLLPMVELTHEILEDLFTRSRLGIETPSAWLNSVLNGGWLPGRFYVLGAPPGSGKTTLAAWAADHAAANGTPVLFVSYEMSREQLYIYSLARAGEINSALIEGQRWKDEEYPEVEALASQINHAARQYDERIAPWITIMEAGPEVTPAYLKGAVGQVRTQAGLADSAPVLLVIDYLQCMNTGEEALDSGTNETQKASRLATSLKQLARETGAAVIAISDITKQAYQEGLKSGRLNMGALRDSFKISHAADTILLLQSEEIEQLPSRRDTGSNAQQGMRSPGKKSMLQLAQERSTQNPYRSRSLARVEIDYPLTPRLRSSYAELSILKNRGGRLAGPLFVYDRAYHRFTPIELDPQAWEEAGEEDDDDVT